MDSFELCFLSASVGKAIDFEQNKNIYEDFWLGRIFSRDFRFELSDSPKFYPIDPN